MPEDDITHIQTLKFHLLAGSQVCLFVGCLMSLQQASVSQGRICSDNFTCCHTEIEVADQTFHLTQSQYTDTGPTGPSTDPITPAAWQVSHWSADFLSHRYDSTPEKSRRKRDSNPRSSALEADALTTRPMRRCQITRNCPAMIEVTAQVSVQHTVKPQQTVQHQESKHNCPTPRIRQLSNTKNQSTIVQHQESDSCPTPRIKAQLSNTKNQSTTV